MCNVARYHKTRWPRLYILRPCPRLAQTNLLNLSHYDLCALWASLISFSLLDLYEKSVSFSLSARAHKRKSEKQKEEVLKDEESTAVSNLWGKGTCIVLCLITKIGRNLSLLCHLSSRSQTFNYCQSLPLPGNHKAIKAWMNHSSFTQSTNLIRGKEENERKTITMKPRCTKRVRQSLHTLDNDHIFRLIICVWLQFLQVILIIFLLSIISIKLCHSCLNIFMIIPRKLSLLQNVKKRKESFSREC